MASILVPVAYVIVVFGSLFVFSYFYRKHTASKSVEPYFSPHHERNVYVTLLGRTDPPASDALLKAALVRRAMADVNRVLRLREDKPALQNLLQKGSIGDDLWNSLLAAEKELEAEIMEVVAEANTFVEGWGQVIFPTANEMIANEKMRAIFEATSDARAEKETKYGVKTKPSSQISTNTASTIATPQSSPQPTTSSSKSPNGLAPPQSAGNESAVSSDAESTGSPASPAASPRSPKSAKKHRKRK